MNLFDIKAKGETKFIVIGKNGNIKQDTGWTDNLLLDSFFAMDNIPFSYAKVGTGNTPPQVTDTDISAQLGIASIANTNQVSGSPSLIGDAASGFTYTTASRVHSWNIGDIVGNISEYVLCTHPTNANTAYVRNLIKDNVGNPITISVTEDDQLQLWWRLSKTILGNNDLTPVTTTETVNGVSTDITVKHLNTTYLSTDMNTGFQSRVYGPFRLVTFVGGDPDVATAIAAAAGADLGNIYGTAEQGSNFANATHSYEGNGVAKFTFTGDFPINTS
ncbi:hypothetical protein [Shewanella algae]|uniref:hypothetical protein n=1 Tax=Shewanella algae TaxID=38313 RepID=UPI0031F5C137